MQTSTAPGGRALGILAKAPVPGQVKTRLAADIGPEAAAQWCAQAIATLFARTANRWSDANVVLFYDPPEAAPVFRGMPDAPALQVPQCSGDLGARMDAAFTECFTRGMTRVALVGTDAPTLPLEYIEEAWAMLDTADVALGPARDGGYYLIGLRARHPALFTHVAWSTDRVFEQTQALARSAGLRVATLPQWFDVDTAADLAELERAWATGAAGGAS